MELDETTTTKNCVGAAPYRFRSTVGAEEIRAHYLRLAAQLRQEYRDKNPIFVGVLNGCFIFMADLIRAMNIPCEVDFIKVSSYRDGMSSGELSLLKDVDANLEGRHVIIVEDIVDTGKSIGFLREHLLRKRPASLVMAAMFVKDRPEAVAVGTEYIGMIIPDIFVVGYGLDYAQQWRQLPDLYALVNEE
jgi:hypoxanthine phosphoribosyltransferase